MCDLHGVGNPQLATLLEQENARRCELLRDLPESELRRRRIRKTPLDIGFAIAFAEDYVIPPRDEDRAHELLRADLRVDCLFDCREALCLTRSRDENQCCRARECGTEGSDQ